MEKTQADTIYDDCGFMTWNVTSSTILIEVKR